MTFAETLRDLVRNPPWLELVANVVNLASIALATRNSVHTWWTGIVGGVLFGALFYTSQLYADVTLQVFFLATSVLGWWHWIHHRGQRIERPVTRTASRELALIIPFGAVCALGYGTVLHRFTNAYAPFLDSIVLGLSVIAQLLLMRRKVETWLFWFVSNSIAIPLYASRGLWLTAFFYLLFWCNAPVGFFRWKRDLKSSAVTPESVPLPAPAPSP